MKHHLLCLLGILTVSLLPGQAAFADGQSEAASSDIEAKVKSCGLPFIERDGMFGFKVKDGNTVILVPGTQNVGGVDYIRVRSFLSNPDKKVYSEEQQKLFLWDSARWNLGHWALDQTGTQAFYTVALPSSIQPNEFRDAILFCAYNVKYMELYLRGESKFSHTCPDSYEKDSGRDSLHSALTSSGLGFSESGVSFSVPIQIEDSRKLSGSAFVDYYGAGDLKWRDFTATLCEVGKNPSFDINWFLMQNGLDRVGGFAISNTNLAEKAWIFYRQSVPENAEGRTIRSAMENVIREALLGYDTYQAVLAAEQLKSTGANLDLDAQADRLNGLQARLDSLRGERTSPTTPESSESTPPSRTSTSQESSPSNAGGSTGIRPTTLENVKTMLESEGITFRIDDRGGYAVFKFGQLGFTTVSMKIVDGSPQLTTAKQLPYPIPPTLRTVIQSVTANSSGTWTLSEHENLSASYLSGKETIDVSATSKQLAASAKAFAEIIANVESALKGESIVATPSASSPSRSPSAATPAAGVSTSSSVEQILAKAEDHDGVVLGGFYLGMSPEDALTLCKHYFGHLGTIGIVKHVEKHSNSNLKWGGPHGYTNISPYLGTDDWVSESIVLRYGPGEREHWTICEISCEQDKDSTDQWRWDRGAKKAIYYFRFGPKMMRAMIGKKNVMSSRELGRSFFRKFELDGDIDFNDNIKFDTPEGEHVWFICNNPGPDIRFYCKDSPYFVDGTMIANFNDVKQQLPEP